jgi:hypothetical protein
VRAAVRRKRLDRVLLMLFGRRRARRSTRSWTRTRRRRRCKTRRARRARKARRVRRRTTTRLQLRPPSLLASALPASPARRR